MADKEKLQLIQAKIDELTPYPYNNKDHTKTVRSIMESIEQNGFYSPIQINEQNVIINGHGRWLAMKKLGKKTIPAIVVTWMPEEQQKICRVIDNLTASYSQYDMENLTKEIEHSPDEFLRKLTKSIFKWFLFSDEANKELIEDVVHVVKLWLIKKWDIVQLWPHKIMCWDSTKSKEVSELMNNIKADCVRTDPPYNVNYKGHAEATKDGIMNDKMKLDTWTRFTIWGKVAGIQNYLMHNYPHHKAYITKKIWDLVHKHNIKEDFSKEKEASKKARLKQSKKWRDMYDTGNFSDTLMSLTPTDDELLHPTTILDYQTYAWFSKSDIEQYYEKFFKNLVKVKNFNQLEVLNDLEIARKYNLITKSYLEVITNSIKKT